MCSSLCLPFLDELALTPHARSIEWLGYTRRKGRPGIVMEFMPRGSLWGVLRDSRERDEPHSFSVEQQRAVALDIACGMAYLHAQPILHLDLKSPNILLTNNLHAKVADFGLARIHTSIITATAHSSTHAPMGTYYWCERLAVV